MPKRIQRRFPRAAKAVRAPRPVAAVARRGPDGSTPDQADPFRSPLARLIEAPHFLEVVPHLTPDTLHQLIQHAGLDACGELVASMTPQQLTSVFDADLWRSQRPGLDDQFDAERFGEWLELLVETSASDAARIVAALDEPLLIAGLSRHVRVYDLAAIAPPASSDDGPVQIGTAAHADLEWEVDGYLVRATRGDAWDAIVALLHALDVDHHDCFHALMQGCRRLSHSAPEVDGLDVLLTAPEQLLHDVALDRERRRSRQGYSTRPQARAFLQMARQRQSRRPENTRSTNPIAAAYLRAAENAVESADDTSPPSGSAPEPAPSPTAGSVPEGLDAIVGLLEQAGLVAERPRALLSGAQAEPPRLTQIRTMMEYVGEKDDSAHLMRNQELAFLANTLMAGCSLQSRSFTPQEASDAAVGVCNLGLEHWPDRWPEHHSSDPSSSSDSDARAPESLLIDHDLVTAFEVGWAVLHEDVCLYVADQLIIALANLRRPDTEVDRELRTLRMELVKHRRAGTPWGARHALDVIATLDMPAWVSLLGLISEFPVLPAALGATLERRTGAVSATAFEFISTTSQIAAIRAFMARLPSVLRS